jgi:chromosome segregation ATPase
VISKDAELLRYKQARGPPERDPQQRINLKTAYAEPRSTIPDQQNAIASLTAELEAKDEALATKTGELAEMHNWAKQQQTHLHNQHVQAQAAVSEERRRREEAEVRLARVLQAQQQAATQTTEIEELRRLVKFFKGNCEQVSKQAREATAANRGLQASLTDKERILDEQSRRMAALREQVESMGR